MSELSELTYGQKLVSLNFNPSENEDVKKIKTLYASVIDKMNDLRSSTGSQEQKRQCSIAITEAQTAQMWAVKALFAKD